MDGHRLQRKAVKLIQHSKLLDAAIAISCKDKPSFDKIDVDVMDKYNFPYVEKPPTGSSLGDAPMWWKKLGKQCLLFESNLYTDA